MPEPKPLPKFIRAAMLVTAGVLVMIGVAGVILPLLPGVPFLLLAGVLLARATPKFYRKIYQHPRWGRWIRPIGRGKVD